MAASANTASTTPIERAILVTDIPYVFDDSDPLRDKLELYFGKAKHGGGEIEKVVCPIAGSMTKAIVVFESENVREKVIEYGRHIFEDEVITVRSLPPIFSVITVEVDEYYFDIIPREAASKLINTLKTQLGEDIISGGKYVIDTLSGSLDELEALREIIPKTAVLGAIDVTTASSVKSECISRGVDMVDIPFVTEDVDKLKEYLCRSVRSQLDDVITPVGGSTRRAILIFKSVAERDKYYQQTSHPFHGSDEREELSIHYLPRVFKTATATLDTMYTRLIPRSKLHEMGYSDVVINGNKMTATTIEQLRDAVDVWADALGLSLKIQAEFESKTAEASFTQSIETKHDESNPQMTSAGQEETSNCSSWVNVSKPDLPAPSINDDHGKGSEDRAAGRLDEMALEQKHSTIPAMAHIEAEVATGGSDGKALQTGDRYQPSVVEVHPEDESNTDIEDGVLSRQIPASITSQANDSHSRDSPISIYDTFSADHEKHDLLSWDTISKDENEASTSGIPDTPDESAPKITGKEHRQPRGKATEKPTIKAGMENPLKNQDSGDREMFTQDEVAEITPGAPKLAQSSKDEDNEISLLKTNPGDQHEGSNIDEEVLRSDGIVPDKGKDADVPHTTRRVASPRALSKNDISDMSPAEHQVTYPNPKTVADAQQLESPILQTESTLLESTTDKTTEDGFVLIDATPSGLKSPDKDSKMTSPMKETFTDDRERGSNTPLRSQSKLPEPNESSDVLSDQKERNISPSIYATNDTVSPNAGTLGEDSQGHMDTDPCSHEHITTEAATAITDMETVDSEGHTPPGDKQEEEEKLEDDVITENSSASVLLHDREIVPKNETARLGNQQKRCVQNRHGLIHPPDNEDSKPALALQTGDRDRPSEREVYAEDESNTNIEDGVSPRQLSASISIQANDSHSRDETNNLSSRDTISKKKSKASTRGILATPDESAQKSTGREHRQPRGKTTEKPTINICVENPLENQDNGHRQMFTQDEVSAITPGAPKLAQSSKDEDNEISLLKTNPGDQHEGSNIDEEVLRSDGRVPGKGKDANAPHTKRRVVSPRTPSKNDISDMSTTEHQVSYPNPATVTDAQQQESPIPQTESSLLESITDTTTENSFVLIEATPSGLKRPDKDSEMTSPMKETFTDDRERGSNTPLRSQSKLPEPNESSDVLSDQKKRNISPSIHATNDTVSPNAGTLSEDSQGHMETDPCSHEHITTEAATAITAMETVDSEGHTPPYDKQGEKRKPEDGVITENSSTSVLLQNTGSVSKNETARLGNQQKRGVENKPGLIHSRDDEYSELAETATAIPDGGSSDLQLNEGESPHEAFYDASSQTEEAPSAPRRHKNKDERVFKKDGNSLSGAIPKETPQRSSEKAKERKQIRMAANLHGNQLNDKGAQTTNLEWRDKIGLNPTTLARMKTPAAGEQPENKAELTEDTENVSIEMKVYSVSQKRSDSEIADSKKKQESSSSQQQQEGTAPNLDNNIAGQPRGGSHMDSHTAMAASVAGTTQRPTADSTLGKTMPTKLSNAPTTTESKTYHTGHTSSKGPIAGLHSKSPTAALKDRQNLEAITTDNDTKSPSNTPRLPGSTYSRGNEGQTEVMETSEQPGVKGSSQNTDAIDIPKEMASEFDKLDRHKEEHIVSVDALTCQYINKMCTDVLKEIRLTCKLHLQTPNSQKPNEQLLVFTPRGQGSTTSSADKVSDAKEKFISLYQHIFFKMKRVSIKCDSVLVHKAELAKQETEKKIASVFISNDGADYIFYGEDMAVSNAIKYFREKADILPKLRRLKQPQSSDTISSRAVGRDQTSQNMPSGFYPNAQTEIIVLKADITKQRVDAIVNAANGRLHHGGGVAGAIARAAGPQLQSESDRIMRNQPSIPVGNSVETKPYRLPCQYVIHAVGPTYSSDKQNFFADLLRTFSNVLTFAEWRQSRSIAIPLISSGNFGGPKDSCTDALAMAIMDFCSSNERKHLRQIYLVNIDQEATSALQKTFSNMFSSKLETTDSEVRAEQSTIRSDIKPIKFKTDEGIEVVVTKGDITKGKADAIVNAANGRLEHGGGVAGAIAKAAGKGIREESRRIMARYMRPLQVGEYEVTDGYNLNCKVIHAVGPIYSDYKSDSRFMELLKKTFLAAIRCANLPIEAKRVVIPLISSGIYGGPKHLCAKALVDAVMEFSRSEKSLVIQQIYLVNIDDESTIAVRNAFQTQFSPGISDTSGGAAGKSVEVSDTAEHEQADRGSPARSDKVIKLRVLQGDITQQRVDAIVNPTSPILSNNGGVGGAITDAAGYKLQQQCNYIYKEQRKTRTLDVSETVVTNAYDLPCKSVIHTLGPSFNPERPNDFTNLLQQTFLSCIMAANSNGMTTMALPLIGSSSAPSETCARAFAEAIAEFDKSGENVNLVEIIMITKGDGSYAVVQRTLAAYFTAPSTHTMIDYKQEHHDRDRPPATKTHETVAEYVYKTDEHIKLVVRTDDISRQTAEVIVNITDSSLYNGGDKALCQAAGPKLQKECTQLMKERKSPLKPGECLATDGYDLKCKKVLHISPPTRIVNPPQTDDVFSGFVRSTYLNGLLFARTTLRATSLAIPLIGAEGITKELAASTVASAVKQFSHQTRQFTNEMTIYFVNSDPTYTTALSQEFRSQFIFLRSTKGDSQNRISSAAPSTKDADTGINHPLMESNVNKQVMKAMPGKSQVGPFNTGHEASNRATATSSPTSNNSTGARSKGGSQRASGSSFSPSRPSVERDRCQICKDRKKKLHPLEGCQHVYCLDCIQDKITPESACQVCGSLYGQVRETHLDGKMTYFLKKDVSLKGSTKPGVITMIYSIPSGMQQHYHPRPKCTYTGSTIKAYLPPTKEGQDALFLLKSAFVAGHIFQIVSSYHNKRQYERADLADIPLKTNTSGGVPNNGYPDPNYLDKLQEVLHRKRAGVDLQEYSDGSYV